MPSCCSESALSAGLGPYQISLEQQLQFHFLCEDVELHSYDLGGPRDVNAEISRLATTVARPNDPERAKVPVLAAQVAPEDPLPAEKAKIFTQQEKFILHPEPPARPRRCHMISEQNAARPRVGLLAAHAAILWPVEDIPSNVGEPLVAGWFQVPHSEFADRLILDRRPQNHGERRLAWLRLPLGCQLGKLVLAPSKSCRGSGYDLTTFFSQLREHCSGLSRQCVGRFSDDAEAMDYRGVPGKLYVLAMICLGMGDVNSTDIAQETHIAILEAGNAIAPGGLMQ